MGEQVRSWTLVAERWACMEPIYGREFFAMQQRGANVTTRFTMRWVAGLAVEQRIVCDNRVFDVKYVRNVEGRKAEVEVLADELVGVAP